MTALAYEQAHDLADFLDTLAGHLAEGRIQPITTRRLDGLSVESLRSAHELVKSGRTTGNIVITT